MKKIFTLVFISCISLCAVAQTTTTYFGNGGTGFGNFVGASTLAITEDAVNLTFKVTKTAGGGNFSDALVIYIDAYAGGENSTAPYNDQSDNSRSAISGLSQEGRALLTFPTGFGADFAIVAAPTNTFAGLYALNPSGSFTYIQSAFLSPIADTTRPSYTFQIAKANIGFGTTTASFKFVGTYLRSGSPSPGAFTRTYRSNEGYGAFSYSGIADANGNPGYNNTTANTALIYPLVILPVKLLSFTGSVVDAKGKLTWQVANDNEISRYELEKSTDGKQFTTLQTLPALRNSALQTYTTDDATLSGSSLYRLKTTDLKGGIDYSKIVQLSIGVKGQGFTIFPNPVQQTLNLKPAKLEKGRYDINVYSAAGQLVLTRVVQYDGLGNTLQVELPGNMPRGNYNCILSNATGKYANSFLKQ